MVSPAVATTAQRPALTEELCRTAGPGNGRPFERAREYASFTDRPVIEAFGFYREAAHEAGRQE